MFKMWKRWANPEYLVNDGAGEIIFFPYYGKKPTYVEMAMRAEVDDKKMRDVFDAAMAWHKTKNDTTTKMVVMLERVRELNEAIEACDFYRKPTKDEFEAAGIAVEDRT